MGAFGPATAVRIGLVLVGAVAGVVALVAWLFAGAPPSARTDEPLATDRCTECHTSGRDDPGGPQ